MNWERKPKGDHWGSRENSQQFQNLSQGNQVRGATLFVILNCMIYVVCCMIGWLFCIKILLVLSFWKFPEITWRLWRFAKRCMSVTPTFGLFQINRRAAQVLPPGGTNNNVIDVIFFMDFMIFWVDAKVSYACWMRFGNLGFFTSAGKIWEFPRTVCTAWR